MQRVPPWSVKEDGRCLEVEPPGFAGAYLTHFIMWVIFASVLLPLGLFGAIGAALFDDFPVALRVVMGVLGGGATLALLRELYRLFVRAFTQRSRVRVSGEGVLVESKIQGAVQTAWLSPRSAIEVSSVDEGIRLAAGDAWIVLADGHRDRDQDELAGLVRAAIAAGAEAPAQPQPSPLRLGPTWGQWVRTLLHDILYPLRHPTPFLLVDLAVIVVVPILTTFALDVIDTEALYAPAFALFCVGLALRRFDRSYMLGMRYHAEYTAGWTFAYVSSGVALSLAAAMAIHMAFGLGLFSLVLGGGLLLGLHLHIMGRASAPAPRPKPRVLDLAFAATLAPLSILHESAVFSFVGRGARDLGPFALALVPTSIVAVYLPVRIHAFADDPGDRANRLWFWITVIWLVLLPLFGWMI